MRRRRTGLLTAFLALPLLIVGGLCVWIFEFAYKDAANKMPDAERIGAGAGDTGGANALGQLAAGADPDGRGTAADDPTVPSDSTAPATSDGR